MGMFYVDFGVTIMAIPAVVSPVANYVATDPSANVAAFAVNGTVNGYNQALAKINSSLSRAESVKREMDYEISRGSPYAAAAFRSAFNDICARGLQEVNEYNKLLGQTRVALADACRTLGVPPPMHDGTPEAKPVQCPGCTLP
jgi:hypothetical protein